MRSPFPCILSFRVRYPWCTRLLQKEQGSFSGYSWMQTACKILGMMMMMMMMACFLCLLMERVYLRVSIISISIYQKHQWFPWGWNPVQDPLLLFLLSPLGFGYFGNGILMEDRWMASVGCFCCWPWFLSGWKNKWIQFPWQRARRQLVNQITES